MAFSTNTQVYKYTPLPPSAVGEDPQRRLDQEIRNLRRTIDSLTQLVGEMREHLESQP